MESVVRGGKCLSMENIRLWKQQVQPQAQLQAQSHGIPQTLLPELGPEDIMNHMNKGR